MKMIYQVEDKPKFRANLVFAFQQLLAIITYYYVQSSWG